MHALQRYDEASTSETRSTTQTEPSTWLEQDEDDVPPNNDDDENDDGVDIDTTTGKLGPHSNSTYTDQSMAHLPPKLVCSSHVTPVLLVLPLPLYTNPSMNSTPERRKENHSVSSRFFLGHTKLTYPPLSP